MSRRPVITSSKLEEWIAVSHGANVFPWTLKGTKLFSRCDEDSNPPYSEPRCIAEVGLERDGEFMVLASEMFTHLVRTVQWFRDDGPGYLETIRRRGEKIAHFVELNRELRAENEELKARLAAQCRASARCSVRVEGECGKVGSSCTWVETKTGSVCESCGATCPF